MRARTIGAALVGLALLGASGVSAEAATKKTPKPPCNIVPDVTGDVKTGNQTLDVTSADIVTDGKTITVAIRLGSVSSDKNPMSPTGQFYEFAFASEGVGQSISGSIDPTGKAVFNKIGKMTLDPAHKEVRMSMKVDDLTGHPTFRKGAPLTNLVVRTDFYNGLQLSIPVTVVVGGDSASTPKPYIVGTPSCVKLGS